MWKDDCQLFCRFVSPAIVMRFSKGKSVNPEVLLQKVFFPCRVVLKSFPLDDIRLSYRIIWPDFFSWYCVAEWLLCVTFSNLRISVKRVNGTALYTLFFLFYIYVLILSCTK